MRQDDHLGRLGDEMPGPAGRVAWRAGGRAGARIRGHPADVHCLSPMKSKHLSAGRYIRVEIACV